MLSARTNIVCIGLVVTCALGGSACSLKAPSTAEIHLDPGTTQSQVKNLLKTLYPDLSNDEIDALSKKLDLDTALELKIELDDIRKLADKLSRALQDQADKAAQARHRDLQAVNDGFPDGLEPLGRAAFYDAAAQQGRIDLSAVYQDHTPIGLAQAGASIAVSVDGVAQDVSLDCVPDTPVDIVFLVDITGSMSPVIGAVRRSLLAFVDAIVARHVQGTLSVVTYQDSVGVDVDFQSPKPDSGYERSPFFTPVDIDDAEGVDRLSRFITRLQANSGADTPENLAGAIDFARNDVIGLTSEGQPNVIGDGVDDPRDVRAWPALSHAKQIFVVFTDAPFHSDSRTPLNSSLLAPFKPRPIADIVHSLQATGTTVHVSDPSWVDETTTPTGAADEVSVDSDLWAIETGGVGQDRSAGYSLTDLEVLVVSEDTGLLDILLDGVIGTDCSLRFALPNLDAEAAFELTIELDGHTFEDTLSPVRL